MKKLLSAFLAALLLVSLCACAGSRNGVPASVTDERTESSLPAPGTETPVSAAEEVSWTETPVSPTEEAPESTDGAEEPECELTVIDFTGDGGAEDASLPAASRRVDASDFGGIQPIGLGGAGGYAVLYYSVYGGGRKDTEECLQPEQQYLAVFDLRENRFTRVSAFENPDGRLYALEAEEDGFTLFDSGSDSALRYDYALGGPERRVCVREDVFDRAERGGTADRFNFDCRDGFASSAAWLDTVSLLFYDDPERYYLTERNNLLEFRRACGHRILAVDDSGFADGTNESVLRVMDFDSLTEISRLTIPNSGEYGNLRDLDLGGSLVCASTAADDGSLDKIYLWQYDKNPENTPFPCETFLADEIDAKIKTLCGRVSDSFGVTLEVLPEYDFLQEMHAYTNDCLPVIAYQKALQLEQYLSLFPKELYSGLVCGDMDNPVADFDGMRIFLLGEFTADCIDAYVSDIGCDETDGQHVVLIAFSVSGLSRMTFFHELMHCLEYRIWNYEPDFDAEWEALNPAGFSYSEDYAGCYYGAHEEWQPYFTRDYGMSNILEDRATCFETLCDSSLSEESWWLEYPHIAEKMALLSEVLEKSFPSLRDGSIWRHLFTDAAG